MNDDEIKEAIALLKQGKTVGCLVETTPTGKKVTERVLEKLGPNQIERSWPGGFKMADSPAQFFAAVHIRSTTIDKLYLDGIMSRHFDAITHAMACVREPEDDGA